MMVYVIAFNYYLKGLRLSSLKTLHRKGTLQFDVRKKDLTIYLTGPKQNSVNEFWGMVWQTNTTQIVMLTNLVEGTKVISNCHVNKPSERNKDNYKLSG